MSVIPVYVRIADGDLNDWRSNPEMIRSIASGQVAGAELCDVDKAYQAIAWLVSPVKREEQRRYAASLPDLSGIDPGDSAAWVAAFANVKRADYSGLQPDLLLTAIEGRAPDDARDAQIQYGLGAACVFAPVVVQKIERALNAVTPESLHEHFNSDVMMKEKVDPEIWDEGEVVFDQFLQPGFERLRAFFGRAASSGQNVVVVYT